jgi:hypothetical protein
MNSKYIIVELESMEVPMVFSRLLQHEDVALVIRNKVRSAGFCELDPTGKWIAGGGSISLKLNARQQDAKILNEHLGNNSIPHPPSCKPVLTAH